METNFRAPNNIRYVKVRLSNNSQNYIQKIQNLVIILFKSMYFWALASYYPNKQICAQLQFSNWKRNFHFCFIPDLPKSWHVPLQRVRGLQVLVRLLFDALHDQQRRPLLPFASMSQRYRKWKNASRSLGRIGLCVRRCPGKLFASQGQISSYNSLWRTSENS